MASPQRTDRSRPDENTDEEKDPRQWYCTFPAENPARQAPGTTMETMTNLLLRPYLDYLVHPCLRLVGWGVQRLLATPKRHNIWTERLPRLRYSIPDRRPPPRSPLSELPEELLLLVMRDLDGPSLLCLRRTSRQFMRLFGDEELKTYHGEVDVAGWQSENVDAITTNKEIRTFRALLAKDRLCICCLAARAGPDSKMSHYESWAEEPLHCSGCAIDHPSCAFSIKQRDLPATERICIAREGKARICRHRSLTWGAIEKEVLHHAAPASLFACSTREGLQEIRFAFYGETYRIAMARGVRWRYWISRVEWDWDHTLPIRDRDLCSERDYTWLSAEASLKVPRPLIPESFWYRQVDPASFGLRDDAETFGCTWCRTRTCPNYWKCFELRRERRVYIPCEEGCGRTSSVGKDCT